MFSVGVRDHVMIAHSFRGELFGPAQALHGATYVVDVEFFAPVMHSTGVVVDIGRAHDTLRTILGELNYKNLDDLEMFEGKNTTTEFLAFHIWSRLAAEAHPNGGLGPGAEGIESIGVTLNESHVAWASYRGNVERL